jgi:hypothetical protein
MQTVLVATNKVCAACFCLMLPNNLPRFFIPGSRTLTPDTPIKSAFEWFA